MQAKKGITHWDGPPLDAWEPWSPDEARSRLAATNVPWAVVGGWSIDLWLGRETRAHDDLEIAIPRSGFREIRNALCGFVLHTVGDGEVRRLSVDGQPPPEKHQNWVLDVAADKWRADIMLEPGNDETWIFRRDERISAPRCEVIASRNGIPYQLPQVSLLYKAKNLRDKDQADFELCVPMLSAGQRKWLLDSLRFVHSGHPWIERLEDPAFAHR